MDFEVRDHMSSEQAMKRAEIRDAARNERKIRKKNQQFRATPPKSQKQETAQGGGNTKIKNAE
jgi:hypothetical protein